MWQKNVQNRIINVRESSLEVRSTQEGMQFQNVLKGQCWTCLVTHSASWWLLLKFWHMADGTRNCCCNPQCSDIVCSESEIFSVVEGIHLLTCFLLNYTLNSHSPILIRLFFYNSLTLPGGGVFFIFSCTSVSCFTSWLSSTNSMRL